MRLNSPVRVPVKFLGSAALGLPLVERVRCADTVGFGVMVCVGKAFRTVKPIVANTAFTLVVRWCADQSAGLLIRWSDGPMVRWPVGLLVLWASDHPALIRVRNQKPVNLVNCCMKSREPSIFST